MKITFTILHLFLFSTYNVAQVNLDSILNHIKNSNYWINTKTVDYLMEPFIRFEKTDSTEIYDFYIDSSGNLSEVIGLSGVYMQFDKQKRLTKRIGFNFQGNYYFWDFSPIELRTYRKDTTLIDYYNSQFTLTERVLTIKDFKEREIEKIYYVNNLKLISRVVYKYNDLQNELLTIAYDSSNKVKIDKDGVGIKYQKFRSENMSEIIEERFYDAEMNLVDAYHDLSDLNFIDCSHSIVKREIKDGEEILLYIDSKGELQCESRNLNIFKIIKK